MPKFAKQKPANRKTGPLPDIALPTAARIQPSSLRISRVSPKNDRQKSLLESIDTNALTMVLGTAGTGKSYLVVYAALKALAEESVKKIVISRPAVEAGESIGFLPGTMAEKLDPYLRPLIDAFKELIGPVPYQSLRDQDIIEILPFGYMRGMSIKNSFIILDECQNATADQLKTALTRIGEGSSCVVTADPQQIDLPNKTLSSVHDWDRFRNTRGIGLIEFLPSDVLRSRIVRTVLECYAS